LPSHHCDNKISRQTPGGRVSLTVEISVALEIADAIASGFMKSGGFGKKIG